MDSSPAPTTRALLVRHGQSEWNAVGRWQGQADPPLSDLGRRQARELEERFPGYLDDPRRPPGWEPDEHLLARALRALQRIARDVPGGDVLVVTHGGLVYTVEGHLGTEFSRLANAEGRWVEIDGRTGRLRLGDRVLLADPADLTVPGQI